MGVHKKSEKNKFHLTQATQVTYLWEFDEIWYMCYLENKTKDHQRQKPINPIKTASQSCYKNWVTKSATIILLQNPFTLQKCLQHVWFSLFSYCLGCVHYLYSGEGLNDPDKVLLQQVIIEFGQVCADDWIISQLFCVLSKRLHVWTCTRNKLRQ